MTESAAATLTEEDIPTGLNAGVSDLAMEIWEIITSLSAVDFPAANTTENITIALNGKADLAAMPNLIDNFTLYYRQHLLKTNNNAAVPTWVEDSGFPTAYVPVKPQIYAGSQLPFYIISSNAAASTGYARIGFIYVEVDQTTYYEILQAWGQLIT